MTTIVIKDLEENQELDRKALAKYYGGYGYGYSNPYGTGFSLEYIYDLVGGSMPSLPSVWDMMPTALSIPGYVPWSRVIGGIPGSGIPGISSSIFNMSYG